MTADDRPLRLRITRLGSAGDGVAEGPTHVPGGLPGEVVTARPMGRGVAVLEAVEVPSPDRVAPPCSHFLEGCGGCAIQHLALPAGSAWKRARLVEALSRAGYPDAPVGETVETPPNARRRADLALRRRPDGTVAVGFHPRGSAEVLDLRECHVLRPELFALLPPLRALLRRLPALNGRGSAVVNLLDTGPDILLRTDGALDAAGRRLLAAFAASLRLPRVAWARGDDSPEVAAQSGPVRLTFGGARSGSRSAEVARPSPQPSPVPGSPSSLLLGVGLRERESGAPQSPLPLHGRGRDPRCEASSEGEGRTTSEVHQLLLTPQAKGIGPLTMPETLARHAW